MLHMDDFIPTLADELRDTDYDVDRETPNGFSVWFRPTNYAEVDVNEFGILSIRFFGEDDVLLVDGFFRLTPALTDHTLNAAVALIHDYRGTARIVQLGKDLAR